MRNQDLPDSQPPRWADKLLAWRCPDYLLEEVLGDLHELFEERVAEVGLTSARRQYALDVLGFMQPFAFRRKPREYPPPNYSAMLRSYLTIAWRNLAKQKVYSAIKVGGFAAGITACLLIGLYIRQELSYDQHYANRGRIFRILESSSFRGETGQGVHFPAPFANVLQAEYPDLEKVGHYNAGELFGAGSNEVRRTDQLESTHEEGFVYVSQGLVDILGLPFIRGNAQRALTQPNSVVITQRKAEKYFPHQDPMGKLFILNNDEQRQYKVAGVIEDFPATSHLQCDFLLALAGKEFYPGEQTDWRSSNYLTYVLVRPGT
ncbi:MAG: ABC transporter permease, partial [Ferruginibacter sp.]|nr:ABC transporter permease [Cytophagales bacterium]